VEAKRYPWNIDEVDYGYEIPESRLIELTGEQPETTAYQLAVLQLKSRLEQELCEAGKHRTVAQRRGVLRVLTPREDSDYQQSRARNGIGILAKAHRKNLELDKTKLDYKEAQQHERRTLISGAMLTAAVNARKNTIRQLKASERNTPKLG